MNQVTLLIGSQVFWIRYSGEQVQDSLFYGLKSLFSDSVDQTFAVNPVSDGHPFEVIRFKKGVTDNPAHSFSELLSFAPEFAESSFQARTFQVRSGLLNQAEYNPLIEEKLSARDLNLLPFAEAEALPVPPVRNFQLSAMSDAELLALSQRECWALSADEMKVLKAHYQERPATDVELEIFAQSWSEHCKHKIFAAEIDYDDEGKKQIIDSLFKTYIQKPTFDMAKDWAISVFKDNAGIVRFHEGLDLCIKVETHNSPSALDPFGGALTGILGVNRDILGTGLGAKPIANTNVLCFGLPYEAESLPQGLLHPETVLKGVHKGIEAGGNKSGIPTVNGAILFHESFSGKPLVFCGTVGVLPPRVGDRDSSEKGQKPGQLIVVVGGSVGKDGIHGATASSIALDSATPAGMVQIGDPLTQKRVSDFLLEARDRDLYDSITDNGAGGLSSSVGEMAELTRGARVDLDQVPLKYPGLAAWEIFVSESQERMTLAVDDAKIAALTALANARNVQLQVIGRFTATGRLEVFHQSKCVADIDLQFLHHGLPKMRLKAKSSGERASFTWKKECAQKLALPSAQKILDALACDLNLGPKDKWVRQYDAEVGASTVIKPFEGNRDHFAPNDGTVMWLGPHGVNDFSGAAIGSGLCPELSMIDTRLMAMIAVDEAVRNVIVTGTNPDKIALTDNFCWPDSVPGPKNPDAEVKLGELVKACQGLEEMVRAYEMPLVSGKDSMKNDFFGKRADDLEETKISVLPTLLVTALGYHPDVRQAIKPHAKAGDLFYVLGATPSTEYFGVMLPKLFDVTSRRKIFFNPQKTRALYAQFFKATQMNLIQSAHDVSEGGLAFAVYESLSLYEGGMPPEFLARSVSELFSEDPGRILVSISQNDQAKFAATFRGFDCEYLGVIS